LGCEVLILGDNCISEYHKNSANLVLQAGFNYVLGNNLNLNLDLKIPSSTFKFKHEITNNANSYHQKYTGKIEQSPVVLGFGIGYIF